VPKLPPVKRGCAGDDGLGVTGLARCVL